MGCQNIYLALEKFSCSFFFCLFLLAFFPIVFEAMFVEVPAQDEKSKRIY
jgi:hypothetical protein